jgi:hypothetical protein
MDDSQDHGTSTKFMPQLLELRRTKCDGAVALTRPFRIENNPTSGEAPPANRAQEFRKVDRGLMRCSDDVPIVEGFSSVAGTPPTTHR